MTENYLPFHRPEIGDAEIEAVSRVLRSGWLTTGDQCREFERAFGAYIGAVHAVAVNSCTAALHLALEAAGIGPDDEVIIPTLTFTASAEVCRYLGARPVLVDSRRGTFTMDYRAVEAAITERTR